MQLYKLTPLDPTAPVWQASLHKGETIVRAASEAAARHRAAWRLGQAVTEEGERRAVTKDELRSGSVTNPWSKTWAVRCEPAKGTQFEEEGKEQILFPSEYDPPGYDE
jgi:hypothetical protein